MKELGMVLGGCLCFVLFFNAVIYPDIEIKGFSNESSCTGKCYEEYVALNGTAYEIERRKQEVASADEFSSIKPLWAGCAACGNKQLQPYRLAIYTCPVTSNLKSFLSITEVYLDHIFLKGNHPSINQL